MKTDPTKIQTSRAPSDPEQSTASHSNTDQPRPLDLHQEITAQIVALLRTGVAPWRSGILATTAEPRNFLTKRIYRGINQLLLTCQAMKHAFTSPYWLTFRQALACRGYVRPGEQGSLVVFWKQTQIHDDEDEQKTVPVMKRYYVFNLDQCDCIERPVIPQDPFHAIEEAQRIVGGYVNGPRIEHAGTQAFYRPLRDTVTIPTPESFQSPQEYYATLFHELAHSTGHSSRLGRLNEADLPRFGAPEYGQEELVAELAAAFLCRRAAISPAVIENQAAYIQGWLDRIQQDSRLITHAASAAQKAADRILGETASNEMAPQS